LAQVRGPWLLAYLLCAVALAALLVIRWHYLLADQTRPQFGVLADRQQSRQEERSPPSLAWCAVIWARSQVINLLPLSQAGGDLYRIERASRYTGGVASAVGIIATERITGLMAMVGVAVAGLAGSRMLSIQPADLVLVGGSAVLLGAIAIRIVRLRSPGLATAAGLAAEGLVPAETKKASQSLRSPTRRRPGNLFRAWQDHLCIMAGPLRHSARHPRRFLVVLSLSIAAQVLAPLSYVTVDRALGFNTPVWCYLVAVPAVTLATFLPIHIAGIGILEGGLWLFLSRWSARSSADVVAISAAIRLTGLLWLAILTTSFLWPLDRSARRAPPDYALDGLGARQPGHQIQSPARDSRVAI
jgi:hypothetical protein